MDSLKAMSQTLWHLSVPCFKAGPSHTIPASLRDYSHHTSFYVCPIPYSIFPLVISFMMLPVANITVSAAIFVLHLILSIISYWVFVTPLPAPDLMSMLYRHSSSNTAARADWYWRSPIQPRIICVLHEATLHQLCDLNCVLEWFGARQFCQKVASHVFRR